MISVIVPAYNAAPWLCRCLDSLLAQTYRPLEVVVVNDGSTDHTAEVLKAYAQAHLEVKVIRQRNSGVTSARMRGVAEALGEWIGFVDADDQVEPDMYRRLMDNARSAGADISHCGHQVVFPDQRVTYVYNSGLRRNQDHLEGQLDLLRGDQIDGSLCTKLFRKALFQGIGGWMDPTITNNEDFLMNFYLFSQARSSVYEDFCPYRYLLREGSASYRVLNRHSIFDPIRARQMILDRCEPQLKQEARNALLRNLLFAYAQLTVGSCRERGLYRQQVRQQLRQQREHFSVLSPRNRLLANMICIAPWSFRLAYRLYERLFRREEQH